MHTESRQLKDLAQKKSPKLLIPIHFLLLEKGEILRIKKELRELKNLFFPADYSSLTIS